MTAAPPHDLESERGLLGDMIALPDRIAAVLPSLAPGDFYSPAHVVIFDGIVALHTSGQKVSVGALREHLARSGALSHCGGAAGLAEVATAGTGAWKRHSETVARLASLRRVLMVAQGLRDAAMLSGSEPAVLVADALRDLDAVQLPAVELPESLIPMDVILDEAESSAVKVRLPWVIPGQLRVGWRCMIIAPEGRGKSTWTRQIAMCVAQGVHPFMFHTIPAVRTLIVDLENPSEAIAETAQPVRNKLRSKTGIVYKDNECWVWHEPGGIDLRQPRWRAEFERVLTAVQPGFVCLGPMYKAYRTNPRESDELATAEVQNVFDDLRVRHRFALMLEHHAPKSSGGMRDLVPYGSSLWLRWPEFGLKLVPGDNQSLAVERWREDRLQADWPNELHRGGIGEWPWVGYWKNGIQPF